MKSSFSNPTGNCIDVTDMTGDTVVPLDYNGKSYDIAITETFFPNNHIFTDRANFEAFIQGVKNGEFDHFVKDNE